MTPLIIVPPRTDRVEEQYRQQEHGTDDTHHSEQFLQAGQHGLTDHLGIEFLKTGMARLRGIALVNIAAEQSDIVFLHIFHGPVQNGSTQRGGHTGTDETEHTESLKEMLERDTLGNVDGQTDIKDAITDALEQIGYIETLDVELRINQKIHVILIDYY